MTKCSSCGVLGKYSGGGPSSGYSKGSPTFRGLYGFDAAISGRSYAASPIGRYATEYQNRRSTYRPDTPLDKYKPFNLRDREPFKAFLEESDKFHGMKAFERAAACKEPNAVPLRPAYLETDDELKRLRKKYHIGMN